MRLPLRRRRPQRARGPHGELGALRDGARGGAWRGAQGRRARARGRRLPRQARGRGGGEQALGARRRRRPPPLPRHGARRRAGAPRGRAAHRRGGAACRGGVGAGALRARQAVRPPPALHGLAVHPGRRRVAVRLPGRGGVGARGRRTRQAGGHRRGEAAQAQRGDVPRQGGRGPRAPPVPRRLQRARLGLRRRRRDAQGHAHKLAVRLSNPTHRRRASVFTACTPTLSAPSS
mmetsp:Transcript_20263/g.68975  ORF Transcript_20263/g.68975 Transcript_20263/m.68975 type:complete len:233 (-) Transcript_20263:542-1240(-)